MGEVQKNPSLEHLRVGVCSPVKCYDTSTNAPQPCLDPPKSKWHNGQSRLLNQTFISAECVRSIGLSTDQCQVFSVDWIACDSCPLALSLIGRTRN